MRIPEGVTARCNDFLWTKSSAASLILDGNFADDAILIISGHFFLSDVTNVTANGLYELILNSNSNNEIQTNSVSLPNITLIGNSGQWKLKSDFICGFLTLESGTLITSNFNIEANKFLLMEEHPKSLFLGSSYIKVNGLLDLAPTGVFQDIFINAGTSFIECEELDYRTVTLHDIQINNTVDENIGNTQNGNNPDDILTANQLILNGSGKVTMLADITLNTLILKQDNALLHMDPNESLFINESIISEASIANPATIQSSLAGTQVSITKSIGNLCITGPINFQDIHADMNGVFHSPLGGDNGNNININFSNSSILTPLYWIGNTGSWDTKTNWSNLSGGCPVDKNPNAALRLIFDDNSFISNADIITLPVLTNCKTIDFYNTNYPANFDIQTRLNPLQVIINNANVNFSGAKMFVQSKTVLNGSANLTLDIVVGDTPKYDTPILEINDNSTVLVLSNTLLKVRQ